MTVQTQNPPVIGSVGATAKRWARAIAILIAAVAVTIVGIGWATSTPSTPPAVVIAPVQEDPNAEQRAALERQMDQQERFAPDPVVYQQPGKPGVK